MFKSNVHSQGLVGQITTINFMILPVFFSMEKEPSSICRDNKIKTAQCSVFLYLIFMEVCVHRYIPTDYKPVEWQNYNYLQILDPSVSFNFYDEITLFCYQKIRKLLSIQNKEKLNFSALSITLFLHMLLSNHSQSTKKIQIHFSSEVDCRIHCHSLNYCSSLLGRMLGMCFSFVLCEFLLKTKSLKSLSLGAKSSDVFLSLPAGLGLCGVLLKHSKCVGM